MNTTTANFLKSMKEKIEAEVELTMATQISEKVNKNLQMLVKEGIITKADAEAFGSSCGISVKFTTTRKASLATDGCCHGGLFRGSC